ncbi:MAG: FKBP-type peptidyl-prolyl cis-trans isomerase SlyD (EC [uncultured Campylobacterales bacterium]|uniref:peptidylprolyl isomerase n=1 Tax=uncultured Campylobacterales bacterium TaxID=352960 RepID=A0A6S6T616_9BACT|nr:MAG: FKBP-type peptidyl-prolyl cis-trans isomerase SlyD (EC [uncultured Campylobacterales bacterium]
MQKVSKNTLVSIAIKTQDDIGNTIQESDEIIYLHGGYGQIFQKLEDILDDKKVGDNFVVSLTPKEAFGEYDESLVRKEPLDEVPDDVELGMELDDDEKNVTWVVQDIQDSYVILNGNHELAGISLKISGEILEIEELSDEGVQKILDMEHEH